MNNSKLFVLLASFSKAELAEFEKFAASAFFNKGRNYLPFIGILKKFYPHFDSEKLTPEDIYAKLYPGKRFNRQIIWNLTSSVFNLAEEYLIYHSLKKKPFEKNNLLSKEYYDRRLTGFHMKKLLEADKILDKTGIDRDYFHNKSVVETSKIAHHQMEDSQHLLCDNVLKEGEYRILDFAREITSCVQDLHANAFMFNAQYEINLPEEFMKNFRMDKLVEYANLNKYEYSEVLEIYYRSVMLIYEPDNTSHYYRLKELFEKNHGKFGLSEKDDIITSMTNYCVMKKGNTPEEAEEFRAMLFDINKMQLEMGIAFPDRFPSKILFLQILRNALVMDEIDWAKEYIEKYTPMLKKAHRKPMYSLANAFLNFKIKEFSKVLENLKDVKFIDIRDKLYVKSLLIRTYYELDEIEMVIYQLDSMKHFLANNSKINSRSAGLHMEFLNHLNRLVNFKDKRNSIELELLARELEPDGSSIYRDWLLAKIAETQ